MASRVAQITSQSKIRIIYRTITPNLDVWPSTGELKTLTNVQAIIQSIKNLISTYPGERYYHLDIGSLISRSLFEFVDDFQADRCKQEIVNTIQNYEPRAGSLVVNVTGYPTEQYFSVDISFVVVASGERVTMDPVILRVR